MEQSGPWGRDAVLESRLPQVAAKELSLRARRLRARVVLIRRHGRSDEPGAHAFVATTMPRGSWTESFELDRAADLLDVDLSPLRHGRSVGGTPRPEPLFLVCTNGRHDACCAEYGRPLSATMDQGLGEPVWECSHIGGDRFAGNLLCFPHGVYYGRMEPDDGLAVAALHHDGLIDLGHYRGRSAYPFVAQAADFFLRRARRLDRLDDLRLVAVKPLGDGLWRVTLDGSSQRNVATVRRFADPSPALLTCNATAALRAPRYELLSVETGPP